MSSNSERFPCKIAFGDPPAVKGTLVNRHPTPQYVLAWVCPETKFFENIACEDSADYTNLLRRKWNALPESELAPPPRAAFAQDGTFYLIAMSNKAYMKHLTCSKTPNDPVIQAARVAMGVDKDPSLEATLNWYRWPLNWMHEEILDRRNAKCQLLKFEDLNRM
ncbi:hypothetical protein FB45DRAFT_918697 [Roridomyces roridus]|uniref:Uncharacterized protein n=1 Tax=Roridomyces roridus TaxID=1738132 RepID=A0AAD7BRR6_9AGAR|nr:hypothetical protein FB45DRAFT_918697 [Roridomyces roridus]